jgi:hypothetical protein
MKYLLIIPVALFLFSCREEQDLLKEWKFKNLATISEQDAILSKAKAPLKVVSVGSIVIKNILPPYATVNSEIKVTLVKLVDANGILYTVIDPSMESCKVGDTLKSSTGSSYTPPSTNKNDNVTGSSKEGSGR